MTPDTTIRDVAEPKRTPDTNERPRSVSGPFSTGATRAGVEKATDIRRRQAAVTTATGPATDRRQIGEVRKLQSAVGSFCRECCGFEAGSSGSVAAAVEDCRGPACHLYLWRGGRFHLDEAEAETNE